MPPRPHATADDDRAMLDLAARVGCRGVGRVEPNPMVGCVLVAPGDGPVRPRIIGRGAHERFGGPHAEVSALANCAARGHSAAGSTAYVTLEPCNAHGRNPPCVDALIAARVARVVFARRDPNPPKSGGAERLARAGIACDLSGLSIAATRLADAFIKRLRTGLPWVVAKWAQSIDGRIATAAGESQWITGPRSRLRVHRLRAVVDAVITGVGTVIADDPELTARGVPVRRLADRVVMDRHLRTPAHAKLVRAASSGHVFVAGHWPDMHAPAAARLLHAGVGAIVLPEAPEQQPMAVLRYLAEARGATTVLIEAGPRVLGSFLRAGLVDECQVYVGPTIMGDPAAAPAANIGVLARLGDATRWSLCDCRSIGDDCRLVYRRPIDD